MNSIFNKNKALTSSKAKYKSHVIATKDPFQGSILDTKIVCHNRSVELHLFVFAKSIVPNFDDIFLSRSGWKNMYKDTQGFQKFWTGSGLWIFE